MSTATGGGCDREVRAANASRTPPARRTPCFVILDLSAHISGVRDSGWTGRQELEPRALHRSEAVVMAFTVQAILPGGSVMSLLSTTLLGLVAGLTLLLGLPLGRLRRPAPTLRAMLNATAIGVLLFLVWDVLSAAWTPIDDALTSVHNGTGGLKAAAGYGLLLVTGLAVGLLSLVYYESWIGRQIAQARTAAAAPPDGPGAMGVNEATARGPSRIATWSPARRLSLLIAVGIGLHNFAEGLAIGQSSASGKLALALLLVIGFGLHNATEGFGIVAPLAGDLDPEGHRRLPGWGFLLAMGAIGGGPTFVGTLVGYQFTSEAVSVVFLSLAAGSILYVVTQLVAVAAKARRPDLLGYGLLLGLVAGFLTDAIVTVAGA